MQGQQAISISTLKRQLTFLKRIDQKLEALRRENERLRHIVSNPKARFSRSSLGGLYRVVNSLMSAGPMHNLNDIEIWSEKTRDWLVTLGKRGSGPSNDELDWLADAIGQLETIRDNLIETTEAAIKSAPETSPSDEGEYTSEEADEAPSSTTDENTGTNEATPDSPFDNGNGDKVDAPDEEDDGEFPFTDEPKERSIPEAEFWRDQSSRSYRDRGFRDRTSTIPLALDDLTSVNPAPVAPLLKAPPPVPAVKPGFWRPFAIVSFIGFLAMTGLYIETKLTADTAPQIAVSELSTSPSTPTASPSPSPKTGSPSEAVAAAKQTATAGDAEKPRATDVETASKDTPTVTPADNKPPQKPDNVKKTNVSDSPKKAASKSEKKNEKKASPKKKTDATPAKEKTTSDPNVGTLYIKPPSGGGTVLVLIDGVSRGKAPVRVKLSPGLHEVVFTKDGQKSMRMVPIRPEATKTITAPVLE